jgi:outer membrane protein TolC
MIQLKYDGGNEDKGNLMSTKADEAAARADLVSAQRDLDLAWLKLSQLIGQNLSGEVASIAPSSAEAADIYALSKLTPDYVKAQKTYELADLSQKSNISEFLPTLQLRASDVKTGAAWPPSDNTNKTVGLNLSYNFFPGGSNIADRAIAGANLDKAKENLAQTLNDLVYTLKTSYINYRDALDSLEVAKQSLAANAERAKISNAKYQNGLTTYDQWSLIQNSYIQAQKGLVSSERSALLAEAAWYKSYGGWIK